MTPALRDGIHVVIYRQSPSDQSRVYQVTQLRSVPMSFAGESPPAQGQ